jgi:hypothetical protein
MVMKKPYLPCCFPDTSLSWVRAKQITIALSQHIGTLESEARMIRHTQDDAVCQGHLNAKVPRQQDLIVQMDILSLSISVCVHSQFLAFQWFCPFFSIFSGRTSGAFASRDPSRAICLARRPENFCTLPLLLPRLYTPTVSPFSTQCSTRRISW